MMPLLNYTTTVPVERTVERIQRYLAQHGARAILIEYVAKGEVEAVSFKVKVDAHEIAYRLPVNWPGVYQALRRSPKVPARYCTEAQAKRVGWRNVQDWLQSQIALIESGQVRLEQIMLPFAITPEGSTVYERWRGQLALPPREESSED